MKIPCLLACTLGVLALVVLGSGCASASSRQVRVRPLQTYAIVAADDQGTLSQTELNSIVDTLVQFLLDQGYVRSDETCIDDPGRATTVFRMKIAWNEGRTSFAVVSVAPSSGEAIVDADAAPAETTWAPPPDDGWDYDPWRYDDNFGYAYGPYCPFFTIFPFIPFYGFDHHRRPLPPLVRRPPDHRRPSEHRPPAWSRNRNYVTPVQVGHGANVPLLSPQRLQRPSGLAGSSSAWRRNHPAPEHRVLPAASSSSRPQNGNPKFRPTQDVSPAGPKPQDSRGGSPRAASPPPVRPADRDVRPPTSNIHRTNPSRPAFDNRVSPQDASPSRPPNRAPANRPASGSTQHPASTTGRDQSAPSAHFVAPTRPAPDPDHRPAPDSSARPASSNVRPPPATIPLRAPTPPPLMVPPREPAPSRRDFTPAPSHSPSLPPPAPPATSSGTKADSKSQARDRDR